MKLAVVHRKSAVKRDRTGDWVSPTVARFPDQQSRDRFLRSVEAGKDNAWEVTPIADDGRAASVRWREGHFLRLNDMAYAQHGRIVVTVLRRTGMSAIGAHIARRHRRIAQL